MTFKFWKQKSVFPLVELDLMFHGVVELLDKDMPRTITFFLPELICVTFFNTTRNPDLYSNPSHNKIVWFIASLRL